MAAGRVLVIDDEAFIRELVGDFLSFGEIACNKVATLPDALELMKDNSFNLVLLDRNLETIRGEQIIPRLRRIHPGIPVVIMTGDHQFSENSLKHIAANGVLHKPFKLDEFMQIIGKFLESE
ncbi:MAG: response regulator [Candidatus Aminicenantes bacterium]|nr:response regulator [Candidatus Aminicenantes bacterium]